MIQYNEDEYLPLSALQHIVFCKRQCALIHVEQLWLENQLTAEGRIIHERVDRGDNVEKGRMRIEYSLPIKSSLLGVTGKADVVEFHLLSRDCTLKNKPNRKWIPYPVEYKRGKSKKDNCDKVQLCAQAICLEEMVGVRIEEGSLFYGKTKRREDIAFTDSLREETLKAAKELHEMFREGKTPKPEYSKKCESCSFVDVCMPKVLSPSSKGCGVKPKERNVALWLETMLVKEQETISNDCGFSPENTAT